MASRTRKLAPPLTKDEAELLKLIGEVKEYNACGNSLCHKLVHMGLIKYLGWDRVYVLTDAGRSRLEAIREAENAPNP